MKLLALILLTCATATLQTPDGLRQKYGAPVSETYMVSLGILATVNYSKNGQPCSATVAAQTNPKLAKDKSTRIDNKLMRAIVEELIPSSERGKLVSSGFLNLTCVDCESFYGTSEHYEKVVITIGGPSDEKETASIQWEGRSCER